MVQSIAATRAPESRRQGQLTGRPTLASFGLSTAPNPERATTDLLHRGSLIGHRIYSGSPSSSQIAKALGSQDEVMLLRPTGLPGPVSSLYDRGMTLVDQAKSKHGLYSSGWEFAIVANKQGAVLGYYAQNPVGDAIAMSPSFSTSQVFKS